MSERKVYVVGGSDEYANWMECEIVRDMDKATLVLLTGGEDVSSKIYGKKSHPTTSSNWHRDVYEIEEFKKAQRMGLPCIGVCRGAQFGSVMSGAKIVQHMSHPFLHDVTTNDGRIVRVSSSHHQMQYINGLTKDDVELVAWAEHLSPFAFGESNDDMMDVDKECEIAYYYKTKLLAIQSHPEYFYPPKEEWQHTYIAYCREILKKYLG